MISIYFRYTNDLDIKAWLDLHTVQHSEISLWSILQANTYWIHFYWILFKSGIILLSYPRLHYKIIIRLVKIVS